MSGQLAKAKLVVVQDASGSGANAPDDPDHAFEFMFNPTEFSISKQQQWTVTANKGQNVPKYEFPGGNPRQLQLELFFDSFSESADSPKRDLSKYLNGLFYFMYIDRKATGRESGMSQPPKCRIEWGGQTKHLNFECYVTNCTVHYKMFDSDGVPIRATASLTLQEALSNQDEDQLPTNPTSLGEPGRRRRVVAQGDRLDLIAFQEYGDSREWRRLAEVNGLTDPLSLRPGMVLAIPPR
jgi:nucleoid-associated protein YgaU